MTEQTLPLTWGQAAMVQMFHRRGLDPAHWPLSAVFMQPEEAVSREEALAALNALVARHDVLTARFDAVPGTIDLADAASYPRQHLRTGTVIPPLTLSLGSTDAELDGEQLLALVRGEFLRRGDAFLPVLLDRGGRWGAGAVVSHVAVDGQGLDLLDREWGVLVRGEQPRQPGMSVQEIVEIEAGDDLRDIEQRDLQLLGEALRAADTLNLRQDPPKGPAVYGVVESAAHGRAMAQLQQKLRIPRPGIALIVFAILLSADLGQPHVLVRSMFRRSSRRPRTVSAVASSPFALVRVEVDKAMSVHDLVHREYRSTLGAYGHAECSPWGTERVNREVAAERGLAALDGLPEFNYLTAGRRARDLDSATVERSWVEFVAGVRPFSRGNLSIFEHADHDSVELFGNRWRSAGDSFTMVHRFDRFCAIAANDSTRTVADVLERAEEAVRITPVRPRTG